MLRPPLLLLSFGLLFSMAQAGESSGQDTSLTVRARTWFEWGEYDSIARRVPLYLSRVEDSATIALLHLYLGVARFASGQIGEARREFDLALAYNPSISLDRNYVSEEVVSLFSATREEREHRLAEKARQDSLLLIKQEQLERESAVADSLARLEQVRLRWSSMAGTIGFGVLSCGMAALSIYEYREAEDAHRSFTAAAQEGNLAAYERYRELVRRGDALTVSAAVLSALSAATSIGFAARARRLKAAGMSVNGVRETTYGVRVVFEL